MGTGRQLQHLYLLSKFKAVCVVMSIDILLVAATVNQDVSTTLTLGNSDWLAMKFCINLGLNKELGSIYKRSHVKASLFMKENEKLVLKKVVHLPTLNVFDIWNLELKPSKVRGSTLVPCTGTTSC